MFDHVQLKVKDLATSRPFYEAVFATLGYKVVFEYGESVVGFGTNPHDMFEVSQSSDSVPLSQHAHVAFKAPTKEAVDAFYDAALTNGATDNGKPGLRPEYEPGYYATFVIDPSGHNLEAVFKE